MFPVVSILQIEKTERNFSLTLAEVINDTTSSLDGQQIILNLLAWVTLDFLLTNHDGIYAIAKISVRVGLLGAYSDMPKKTLLE